MGHTIWVDVEGRAKDDTAGLNDNSIMLGLEKQLDGISKKLRVAKLSDFYDYSVLEEEYGDLMESEEGETKPNDGAEAKALWFDPKLALAAVRAIQKYVSEHPESLGIKGDASRAHWPES
jgi:hypothetical protein